MISAKDLQRAAELERQRADAERKTAEQQRRQAGDYSLSDDMKPPMKLRDLAQRADATAQQHNEEADRLVQKANAAEKEAVKLEGEKETVLQTAQIKADELDARIRQLRGQ